MEVIERSALVPYRAEQMFDLVNDVLSYPQFLGWCRRTEIHHQSESEMEASITVSIGRIEQRFSTRNTFLRPERIEIRLARGPFRTLEGQWQFRALGDDGCHVGLLLRFDLSAGLLQTAFASGFSRVAERMVADFCRRAEDLYD